ncbi:TVP38/TMEM64 family inner membrane protein YdjZ [bacterium BMS3Bbin11]|nr:TVP38/TMEM64 family inner membrane protein YdjZ [bacterium BMS3Abin11]GBE45255.1 TVP38/TMEM64 family inner membrane protein YdjZ [bacterium BMS3Bbin11]HDZ79064.1 sulfurtransferase [Gammaproteobacteria bacterium]
MKSKWIRLGLFLVLAAGIAVAVAYRDQFNAEALENWVKEAGPAGPVIYILIYAVGTVFFLPGSVLTLTGGALFGPVLGTFVNLTGATLGALGSFLIARYLTHDWVANKTGGRIKALMNGVENEGWRFVAFVRLVPLFPFNILNYALGLTPIKLLHYFVATYIFMLPGAIAYTYLGYAGREAIGGGEGLIQKGLLALGLLALVAFLPRIIGKMRQGPTIDIPELKKRLDSGETLVLDVRTAEEFVGEQGHIEGALNIAVEELPKRIDELTDYIEQPIAIICRTDRRSAKAALLLAEHGFHDVHVVRGGITRWIEAHQAVVR